MADLPLILNPDIVSLAVETAKTADQDDFRRNEITWLDRHSPLALMAVEGFFRDELVKQQEEVAQAGYLGALLGSFIARQLAEAEEIDYSIIRSHHRRHLGGKRLACPRELEAGQIVALLGEAGDAVAMVRHPVARSLCSVLVTLSFSREVPPLLSDFIALPERVVPKPRTIRRQARPS